MINPKKPQGQNTKGPLQIYYDGACHVCDFEMAHYRKKDCAHALEFIDIAAPEFKPEAHELDPHEIQKSLHAKDASGNVYQGLDTFIVIWERLPGYHWLSKLFRLPGMSHFGRAGYFVFARFIRPILPKKKGQACESGKCKF